ncbi:MAG: hypothetical protein V8R75_00325 [Oscillospiraceae bacterium]
MTRQEAKAFVEKAFENLQARGWLAEGLKPALAARRRSTPLRKSAGSGFRLSIERCCCLTPSVS